MIHIEKSNIKTHKVMLDKVFECNVQSLRQLTQCELVKPNVTHLIMQFNSIKCNVMTEHNEMESNIDQ